MNRDTFHTEDLNSDAKTEVSSVDGDGTDPVFNPKHGTGEPAEKDPGPRPSTPSKTVGVGLSRLVLWSTISKWLSGLGKAVRWLFDGRAPSNPQRDSGSTSGGEAGPPPTDEDRNRMISVWSTYVDFYMRYLTLAFTGGSLAFVGLAFGLKIIFVDATGYDTKLGVLVVMLAASLVALVPVASVRARARQFAEQMEALDAEMEKALNYRLPTRRLKGTGVMTVIVDAALLSAVVLALCLSVLFWLVTNGLIDLPGL